MITLPASGLPRREGTTRREWLRAGGISAMGLTLPGLSRLRAGPTPGRGQPPTRRARACILAFLFGAPAHQDVWDLKPDAPADIRGEFRPIATRVPGLMIGEHLP